MAELLFSLSKEPGFLAPPLGELSCDSMTERVSLIFAKQILAFGGFSLKIPQPSPTRLRRATSPKGRGKDFLTRSKEFCPRQNSFC